MLTNVDNQFHLHSNASTDNYIPAVLPQISRAKLWDSCHYCGVTADPITMQLSIT